jgi:TetR/AcrR family transcriptional regulator, mexJK operon transcriptional repressor
VSSVLRNQGRKVSKAPPPNGRPTKAHAKQRHDALLDAALTMFLEKGFELASVEAIAQSINMTKRTVYRRYKDKRSLFRESVQLAIECSIAPTDSMQAAVTDDLETSLLRIARIRVIETISPDALRLQRIINAESLRIPEVLRAYEEAALPAVRFIADLIRNHQGRDLAMAHDPEFAARAFIGMIAATNRLVVLGKTVDNRLLEASVEKGVQLFLNGLRNSRLDGTATRSIGEIAT